MSTRKPRFRARLKVGELVEVRSKEEILASLDANGCLDGLPFMPEMFRYCGMRFRVYKRAHKTCDTVFPTRSRKMANAVHLETRCDGEAHGGCQAGCLIFWKETWLRRVTTNSNGPVDAAPIHNSQIEQFRHHNGCAEDDVWRATEAARPGESEPTYVCQATRLPYATTDLHWWDIRQYIEDFRSGNVGIATILKALLDVVLFRLRRKLPRGGWRIPEFYDKVIAHWAGTPWPMRKGSIEVGQATPAEVLNLRPGDLVRVKPYDEILRTLNGKNINRGMSFDKEMVPYCGGEYRVNNRVSKIINERTGKMQKMKTPCIVLDSVVCQARYSNCRLFCPRSIYPYWREIWLERVPESRNTVGEPTACETAGTNERTAPNRAWQAAYRTTRGQREPSQRL